MAGVDTADTPDKTNSAYGARRTEPFGLLYRTSGGDTDDTSRKMTRAIMAKDVDPNATDKRAMDERAWANGKQTAGRGMPKPAQPAAPAAGQQAPAAPQGGQAPAAGAGGGGGQQPAPPAGTNTGTQGGTGP